MKNNYTFLELFGDIDERFIYEAFRPWKKQVIIKSSSGIYIIIFGNRCYDTSGRSKSSMETVYFLDWSSIGYY